MKSHQPNMLDWKNFSMPTQMPTTSQSKHWIQKEFGKAKGLSRNLAGKAMSATRKELGKTVQKYL